MEPVDRVGPAGRVDRMDQEAGRLALLATGDIEVLGQLANSSNETFLVRLTEHRLTEAASVEPGGTRHLAVYKPELGERPLRDFRPGLFHRERAAYLLDRFLGWGLVPPTVVREEAPLGAGSLQWFVDHDPRRHYFTLHGEGPGFHEQLRRVAVFDLLANNADRKAGHVLCGPDGRLWGIDHGLCFAAPVKLRTVIWDFAGERIDAGPLADVVRLAEALLEGLEGGAEGEAGDLVRGLGEHLTWFEVEAIRLRALDVVDRGRFPADPTGMRFPWPLV